MKVGPNSLGCLVFENPWVGVVVPAISVKHRTTKVTLLAFVVRILFGRSRASDPPTSTEVWHLAQSPENLYGEYAKDDQTVRMVHGPAGVEIRRAPWLRIVGPIVEVEGTGGGSTQERPSRAEAAV